MASRDRRGMRTRLVQLRALIGYLPASGAQHVVCQCRQCVDTGTSGGMGAARVDGEFTKPATQFARARPMRHADQVSLTDELRMLIRVCTYEGVRKRGRHTTAGYEVNDIDIPSQTRVHCTVFVYYYFSPQAWTQPRLIEMSQNKSGLTEKKRLAADLKIQRPSIHSDVVLRA
jgi:hypothetical protein